MRAHSLIQLLMMMTSRSGVLILASLIAGKLQHVLVIHRCYYANYQSLLLGYRVIVKNLLKN